jgi:hypothetical protein
MIDPITDKELLREYVECRSDAAFTEIYDRHKKKVFSAACRILANTSDAEDVREGAFEILSSCANHVLQGAHFNLSGWLCSTAQHLALQECRRRIRRMGLTHQLKNVVSPKERGESLTEGELSVMFGDDYALMIGNPFGITTSLEDGCQDRKKSDSFKKYLLQSRLLGLTPPRPNEVPTVIPPAIACVAAIRRWAFWNSLMSPS